MRTGSGRGDVDAASYDETDMQDIENIQNEYNSTKIKKYKVLKNKYKLGMRECQVGYEKIEP